MLALRFVTAAGLLFDIPNDSKHLLVCAQGFLQYLTGVTKDGDNTFTGGTLANATFHDLALTGSAEVDEALTVPHPSRTSAPPSLSPCP